MYMPEKDELVGVKSSFVFCGRVPGFNNFRDGHSTNTPTASSDSTSQEVQTSLFCPMPMSKRARNSTLVPEKILSRRLGFSTYLRDIRETPITDN
jgi:hypothetical protein